MKPDDFPVGRSVTYIPHHAHGNAGHPDCEHGVVTSTNEKFVFVRFGSRIGSQACDPETLRLQFGI